jgi:cell division protein FtsI/penicillin-binding protein 2
MESRFVLVRNLVLGTLGLLCMRLFWIQVVRSPELRERVATQSRVRELLPGERGSIRARSGEILSGHFGQAKRQNPYGTLAHDLLGTLGKDGQGLGGLEYLFDNEMRGLPGWRMERRAANGKSDPGFDNQERLSLRGLDIVTTIDPLLQTQAEEALADGVAKTSAQGGTALVIDARTGDILALASFNREGVARSGIPAVQAPYEPGSTFKLVTLAAALENRKAKLDDVIDIHEGFIRVGTQVIRDSHRHDGSVTLREGLAISSNVCFAKTAMRIGQKDMYLMARSFGFGTPTGADLPGEEGGTLRTPSQWSDRSLQTLAMGQEVTVTALQLAMAYGAVANGGVLMRPRLVSAFLDARGDTVRTILPRPVRQVVSAETSQQIIEALRGVVDHGTGMLARIPDVDVAGKTGTSQKVDVANGRYFSDRFMASFVGMIPSPRHPLICLAVLDQPVTGHTGGAAAAPIFARIVRSALQNPGLPYGRESLSKPENLRQALLPSPRDTVLPQPIAADFEEGPA